MEKTVLSQLVSAEVITGKSAMSFGTFTVKAALSLPRHGSSSWAHTSLHPVGHNTSSVPQLGTVFICQ